MRENTRETVIVIVYVGASESSSTICANVSEGGSSISICVNVSELERVYEFDNASDSDMVSVGDNVCELEIIGDNVSDDVSESDCVMMVMKKLFLKVLLLGMMLLRLTALILGVLLECLILSTQVIMLVISIVDP